MNVIITGIKSRKTLNTITKDLAWLGNDVRVTGSVGNFQVTVPDAGERPDEALKWVIGQLRNLTPEHISNLKWMVKK